MATKFIGRQFNIGIAKEAARGTAVAPTYWLQWDTLTIDDEIKTAKNMMTLGVIEEGVGHDITKFSSKGTLGGSITALGFGLILKATMGTDTVGAVETGVKDHVFTVLETAQHPSLTFTVVEPNSNSGGGFGYPLSMIEELELDFELDKYCTYKITWMGNQGAALSATLSYTAEVLFRPQDGTFKIASALSGLSGASAVLIKKASIVIKKNVVADTVIGNSAPIDNLNQQFAVSGSLELYYSVRTMIDTYLLAGTPQAFSFAFANTAVTIGAASNPTLTVRLAKAAFESVARKVDQKGIVTQTVKFTGYYSLSDSEMLDITLRNTVTTAY